MKNHDDSINDHFQEYLAALDSLVGGAGRYLQIGADGDAAFWMVVYDDVPELGSTTAFTFGISAIPHPAWKEGVVELVVSVDSSDDDWPLSLGAIACSLRKTCPFSFGNVLRFGKPMSNESKMSSYFLFWPTILEKDQQTLRLSDRTITFKQAYPIFESEAEAIAKIGAENLFMTEGVDFSDVSRRGV